MPTESTLLVEYQQQQQWRNWPQYLARIPIRPTDRVIDIGCSIGTMSELLAGQCQEVLGLDFSREFIAEAEKRAIPNARFLCHDLNNHQGIPYPMANGLWMSFIPAYFPDFQSAFMRWTRNLELLAPGAWVAILEINRLFSCHRPLAPDILEDLEAFEAEAYEAGTYDFHSGSRIRKSFQAIGLRTELEWEPKDPELHFNGAARPEIVQAWEKRFARMAGLRHYFGKQRAAEIEQAFLRCLQDPAHRSRHGLYFYVLRKEG